MSPSGCRNVHRSSSPSQRLVPDRKPSPLSFCRKQDQKKTKKQKPFVCTEKIIKKKKKCLIVYCESWETQSEQEQVLPLCFGRVWNTALCLTLSRHLLVGKNYSERERKKEKRKMKNSPLALSLQSRQGRKWLAAQSVRWNRMLSSKLHTPARNTWYVEYISVKRAFSWRRGFFILSHTHTQ